MKKFRFALSIGKAFGRVVSVSLLAALIVSLSACGGKEPEESEVPGRAALRIGMCLCAEQLAGGFGQ